MTEESNTTSPAPAAGGTSGSTGNVPAENATATTKLEPADLTSFLKLQDAIHVFEWSALQFYMSGPTVAARAAVAETVEEFVDDFKKARLGDGCPPGFTATANGRCVSTG